MYQVLWVRQLSLVVGVEVYSITVAVSAFFAGLGAGGAVFGRMADRVASPAKLYAALEVGIALLAVAATLVLPHAAMPFVWMREHMSVLAWLLPFVLVGVPAFVMGGTLPVAVRTLRTDDGEAASEGGLLYAANTVGGIVGALAASFALIPWFGLRGAALAAAVLNLAAAAVVWVFAGREENVTHSGANNLWASATPTLRDTERAHGEAAPWLPLALYAAAGGVALGYEVVWTQAIGQFVSTRAFAFSIVLAVYLAGLAMGAWVGSRVLSHLRDSWGVFGMLIAGAGLVAMLEFAALGPWVVHAQFAVGDQVLHATESQGAHMIASFAVAGLGMVFVPTMLLGAAFPMALRLIVGARAVGRDVGRVVAVNTAGGIVGTLVVGFALIPALGLVRTLALLAIGAAAVGLIAAFSGSGRAGKFVVAGAGLAVIALAVVTPADKLANLLLATRGGGQLVFYEEGRGGTVAIAQQRAKDNVFRRLFIQGVSNSGDAMPSMRYMRLQAMVPLLIHEGEPKSAMVVGFGTGITAGETLRYPGLEKRVVAELLPAVVRSGQMFPENYNAWHDPKMEIRLRDGRQELMRSSEVYDIITLEPPPPSAEGVANLYSTEFYKLARKRLAPKGIFAQWLPITTQNAEQTRGLVRSFLDAFPYATLWTTELHEMLLVGSDAPIRINARRVEERFSPDTVAASLKSVGIDSPAAMLATWVTGREGLERFAASAKPVTDDRPRVEYGPWVHPGEITWVLPEMLAFKTDVPLEGGGDALRAEVEQRRAVLMDFYAAGLAAYGRDEAAWRRSIARVQAAEPGNAYYAWVIGRD
ncbi:fused MFS/spermidine synthase [Edaphobacter sp. HDX4]|uniref:fused MFS/spermidine synthase n=1 Tax=Edaphobacter sp. HDX4 TaxID=2794064 RepID=UPI002FE62774